MAEISKVEFLNNTKDKIVEQVTSIPTNVQVASGNESLTVSWEAQSNVTGYEVKMSYTDPKSGKAETVLTPVDGTSLTISDLTNFVEYKISVQSVNPVSYTHLDVYKRQLYGCHRRPICRADCRCHGIFVSLDFSHV